MANCQPPSANSKLQNLPNTQYQILDTLGTGYWILNTIYLITMKLFTQSLSIFLALAIVLVITNTPLDDYITVILGILIIFSIIYGIIKRRGKKDEEIFSGSALEVSGVSMILLLAIFLTGGLTSNLFFLLYFLMFGLVFLFEPATVFVLLIGLLVVFFTSISDGDLFSNLIRLGSLVFLSPISYFFGREFQRREKLADEINDKTGQIIEDAETLKSHTKNSDAIDEIEDIEKKAKELRNKE
ncbi:MAG TPA: hypothetical protein VG965_03200 [Patescibacteria group bacterium]|nr:hypothetical protein [Patescibacteria group bacterium]